MFVLFFFFVCLLSVRLVERARARAQGAPRAGTTASRTRTTKHAITPHPRPNEASPPPSKKKTTHTHTHNFTGQGNLYFSFSAICGWLVAAVLHATVVLLAVLGCVGVLSPGGHADRAGGQTWSLYQAGLAMFTVVIVTVHLQLAMVVDQWTWMHHASMWGAIALWFVFLLAFGAFPVRFSADLYDLLRGVAGNAPSFWLLVLVVPLMCVVPVFFFRAARRQLRPELYQVVQEVAARERKGEDLSVGAVSAGRAALQEVQRAVSRAGQLVARASRHTLLTPSAGGLTAAELAAVGGAAGGGPSAGASSRQARHRRLRSHTGYVPAYDPKSRVYDLDRIYAAGGAGGSGGGGAPHAQTDWGEVAGGDRSPGGGAGRFVPASAPGELGRPSWGPEFAHGSGGAAVAAAAAAVAASGPSAMGGGEAGGEAGDAGQMGTVDDNPYATTNPVMEHLEEAFARDPRRHRRAASLSLLSLPASVAVAFGGGGGGNGGGGGGGAGGGGGLLPRLRSTSASLRGILPPILRTPSARSSAASTTVVGGGSRGSSAPGSRALSPAQTLGGGAGRAASGGFALSPRSSSGGRTPVVLSPAGSMGLPPSAIGGGGGGAVDAAAAAAAGPPGATATPPPPALMATRLSTLPEAASTELVGAGASATHASAAGGVPSRPLPGLRATGSERPSAEEEEEAAEAEAARRAQP